VSPAGEIPHYTAHPTIRMVTADLLASHITPETGRNAVRPDIIHLPTGILCVGCQNTDSEYCK